MTLATCAMAAGSSTGCPCPGTRFPATTTSATTLGLARQRTGPWTPTGASGGLNIVGADYWSLTLNGWTLLAINAQLAGSGLEAETGQWSWLGEQLSGLSENRRVALITHKPVTPTDTELADSPAYRFLPRSARDRLRGLHRQTPPALVMSGHVHQYRLLRLDGIEHLWAPSTSAVLPDQAQPTLGAKRCGIVSLDLASGTSPEPVLVEPDGIAQLTVGTDIPDPYHS